MSRILTAVCFTFCVVCATVANCGVHAGKKFSTQNECMNISIHIISPVFAFTALPFAVATWWTGWHLAVRYQCGTTSHNNNRISCRNLPHTDCSKYSGYSSLHCAARLFLYAVSTLITEMRVPSLPVSPGASKLLLLLLPDCYCHS